MNAESFDPWPSLPLSAWQDTCATLHMWTEIVGKVRLMLSPYENHWWQVPFYVTARGLTTSVIPYGQRAFEIQFDFIDHRLAVLTSDNGVGTMPLGPRPVAEFYWEFMGLLRKLDLDVRIWPVPVEVENPIPFEEDRVHFAYDPGYANRFWRVLVQSDRVLTEFRSRFIGKCSPVHFFWGGFDLAVTRFSGRAAPEHPPLPNVAHHVVTEAYSHEVSSCGFWPGGGAVPDAAFYSYAYPEPGNFREFPVRPADAFYSTEMGEYLLPYEAVRRAADPDRVLLEFLQSTYEAAAETGHWDRASLERTSGRDLPGGRRAA